MCANDACREPCASDRDCAAGSLCYAATGCILLEGYPLPDGEVVRRELDGVFEAMEVGGEWLYLLGSTSESPLDYGVLTARLDGGKGAGALRPVPRAPGVGTKDASRPAIAVKKGKLFFLDGVGRASVVASPPDGAAAPLEGGPFQRMLPSASPDVVAFGAVEGNRFMVRAFATETGRAMGPAREIAGAVGTQAVATKTGVVAMVELASFPRRWDLTLTDYTTGEVRAFGFEALMFDGAYPLTNTSADGFWSSGDWLVRRDPIGGTLGILDLSRPSTPERTLAPAPFRFVVAEDAALAAARSPRGVDLVRTTIPDGKATTIGWLKTKLSEAKHGPFVAVDGRSAYVSDLESLRLTSLTPYGRGAVYRYRF